jgi:hypothetical protein
LGEEECIQDFGGKPEGKNPIRETYTRWNNNIKMDLKEIG